MKAVLFYLIREFEFELAVNPEDIIRKELCVTTLPARLALLTLLLAASLPDRWSSKRPIRGLRCL